MEVLLYIIIGALVLALAGFRLSALVYFFLAFAVIAMVFKAVAPRRRSGTR